MNFVPVMWSVWSTVVVLMAGLHLYRAGLSRDEAGQIFLDDSFSHEKAAEQVIVDRVAKVEPLLRVAQWLAAAMTVVVIGYYVRFILIQLNVIQ